MSETFNSTMNSKPESIITLLNDNNQFTNIMPSYMRNINSVIQTKQELSQISWEKDGEEVSMTKYLAN